MSYFGAGANCEDIMIVNSEDIMIVNSESGGANKQESRSRRIRLILSAKKSQKRWGRSERAIFEGRGVHFGFPRSSFVTENSCFEDVPDSILSQQYCFLALFTQVFTLARSLTKI